MAKSKKDANIFASLAQKTGGLTLDISGDIPYYVDTGNLSLNYLCSGKFIGGGYPGGRIIEVFGPPATSKSLLGFAGLASCQLMDGIAVLLDCERASNALFAERAGGVNPKELITYEPISIEQVEKKIIAATKAIREVFGKEKPILFVWDSIGVTPTEREWKEVELPENPTAADIKRAGGNERPGERARASGDLLRKINPFIDDNNVTLFVINQVRSTVGNMYGPSEVGAGGGKALEFYASCRLRTSLGKVIESKSGRPLGVNLKFKNKKNRGFDPGLGVDNVQLFFRGGINPIGGLLDCLLLDERIKLNGRGKYVVQEPWADGQEISWTTKATEKAVPMEILLKAPKLIDGDSTEHVQKYFVRYEKALELALGGAIVEKEVQEGDSTVESEIEKILGAPDEGEE